MPIARIICKYVVPPYRSAEMYACRITCCPLVSRGEYADGTDSQTDRQTNGRQTVTSRFSLLTVQFLPAVCNDIDADLSAKYLFISTQVAQKLPKRPNTEE